MSPRPDPTQRQRQAAHLLARLLADHPDLPAIDWTVSQHGLQAHFYLCEADPRDDWDAYQAWTTAIDLAEGRGPSPLGLNETRAHRVIDGVLVILTATIHPF